MPEHLGGELDGPPVLLSLPGVRLASGPCAQLASCSVADGALGTSPLVSSCSGDWGLLLPAEPGPHPTPSLSLGTGPQLSCEHMRVPPNPPCSWSYACSRADLWALGPKTSLKTSSWPVYVCTAPGPFIIVGVSAHGCPKHT